MLYACDSKWWNEYGAETSLFKGERWTVDSLAAAGHGLEWIEGIAGQGLCTREGRVYLGGNSGYQAVGLAYQWGASRIVLLGFDMQMQGGRAHWHADHPAKLGNQGPYEEWAVRFGHLARDLVAEHVEVRNAARATALRCFPQVALEVALRAADRPPLLIRGMQGLGDNIYQRSVVRELSKCHTVYLETSWPEVYNDLNVAPVQPATRLRTQVKNLRVSKARWHRPPSVIPALKLGYADRSGTMLEALFASAGLAPTSATFDLPRFLSPRTDQYIVVRPATVRREWAAPSRNPLPEYIARAAELLREQFHVISVADLEDGEEWPLSPLPGANEVLHRGELSVTELLGLVAGAAGLIGGVGWMAPAAVAYQVPMLLIFGGWGFHNGPQRIFDPRLETNLIEQVMPDRFCMCSNRDHECNKTIANFDERVESWAMGLAARERAAVAA